MTREKFLEEFYDGARERIDIALGSHTALYKNTNFVWNINSRTFGQSTGSRLDSLLYEAVPDFVAATNWGEGFYDGVAYGAISNWTWKSMYQYLKTHFTNTDGTIGVGVYTNSGASTNWYWTQSWETNAWEICLGSLTYSVTGRFLVTNVVGAATNIYPAWTCGWVYTDGDRLVKRSQKYTFNLPYEWLNANSSPWWQITSSSGQHGFLFDWTDEAELTNTVRVATGSTNWSTLATNLVVTINSWTNYDRYEYIYHGTPMLPTSNTLDVSSLPARYTGAIPAMAWDLGGYGYAGSGYTPWFPGLSITNTATVTNFPPTNHIGDTISVWLRCGGRLYVLPNQILEGGYTPQFPTPVQPFLRREMLNERFAVMQLLKVTDGVGAVEWEEPLSYWTGLGETNTASGSSTYETTWAQAKSGAETAYTNGLVPGNVPCAASMGDYYWWGQYPYPYGYLFRANLTRGYAYARNTGIRAGWEPGRTNLALRCDTYAFAQGGPPTYPGGAAGVFDANGDDLINTNWSFFSTTNYVPGWSSVISGPLGSSPIGKPTWCDAPAVGAATNRGWSLPTHYHYFDVVPEPPKMLIYWGFKYVTNSL